MRSTPRFILLALLASAIAPAAAAADSIVYVKGGDVYASRPDGSATVHITSGGSWEWPSLADDGTTVTTNDGDGMIYVINRNVTLRNKFTTPGSYAGSQSFLPNHIRIAPDGSKIAYSILEAGSYRTWWTPTDSTGISSRGDGGLGQEDYTNPSWFNGNLLLSHAGGTFPGQAAFAWYHPGDGENSEQPWFSDSTDPAGYDAAISRDGSHVAALENSDPGGGAIAIRTFTVSGGPGGPAAFGCQIDLPSDGSFNQASPSFSPDGSQIAFSEGDGVHIADFATCQQHLAIAGGSEPYWGAGSLAPSGGGSGMRASFSVKPKRPRAKRAVTFRGKLAGGKGVRWTWSFGDRGKGKGRSVKHVFRHAGRYKVTLTVKAAGGKRATAKRSVTVH